MADYNEGAERLKARRAAKRDVMARLADFDDAEKREILIDALVDLDDSPVVAQQAARVIGPITRPVKRDATPTQMSAQVAVPSVGDLIRRAMAQFGRPMTSPQIIDAVKKSGSRIPDHRVEQWLSREAKRKGDAMIGRRGKRGQFRYWLRDHRNNGSVHKVGVPDPDSVNSKVLAAITEEPTGDYGDLARRAVGGTDSEARIKARNAVYSLAKAKKIQKRADGVWEAVTTAAH